MAGGYIPKEQLAAYTRWQADDFAAPPPAPAPEAHEAEAVPHATVRLPTAEEIERMHAEAQESGHAAGFEAGHAAGYEAGYAEGYQAGLAAAAPYAEKLAALAEGLTTALAQFDQEVAEAVLACALEVARQMTGTALKVQPERLLPIIREALAALPLHHGPVTLSVHPDDAPLVREHLGEYFSHGGGRIQEDPDIAPGGCRLQAGNSEVDASLPTRWRRILEGIGVTPEWLDAQP